MGHLKSRLWCWPRVRTPRSDADELALLWLPCLIALTWTMTFATLSGPCCGSCLHYWSARPPPTRPPRGSPASSPTGRATPRRWRREPDQATTSGSPRPARSCSSPRSAPPGPCVVAPRRGSWSVPRPWRDCPDVHYISGFVQGQNSQPSWRGRSGRRPRRLLAAQTVNRKALAGREPARPARRRGRVGEDVHPPSGAPFGAPAWPPWSRTRSPWRRAAMSVRGSVQMRPGVYGCRCAARSAGSRVRTSEGSSGRTSGTASLSAVPAALNPARRWKASDAATSVQRRWSPSTPTRPAWNSPGNSSPGAGRRCRRTSVRGPSISTPPCLARRGEAPQEAAGRYLEHRTP